MVIIVTFIALGCVLISTQPLYAYIDSTRPSEYTNPFDIDLFDFDRDGESQGPKDDPENKEARKKEETLRQESENISQITIEV